MNNATKRIIKKANKNKLRDWEKDTARAAMFCLQWDHLPEEAKVCSGFRPQMEELAEAIMTEFYSELFAARIGPPHEIMRCMRVVDTILERVYKYYFVDSERTSAELGVDKEDSWPYKQLRDHCKTLYHDQFVKRIGSITSSMGTMGEVDSVVDDFCGDRPLDRKK